MEVANIISKLELASNKYNTRNIQFPSLSCHENKIPNLNNSFKKFQKQARIHIVGNYLKKTPSLSPKVQVRQLQNRHNRIKSDYFRDINMMNLPASLKHHSITGEVDKNTSQLPIIQNNPLRQNKFEHKNRPSNFHYPNIVAVKPTQNRNTNFESLNIEVGFLQNINDMSKENEISRNKLSVDASTNSEDPVLHPENIYRSEKSNKQIVMGLHPQFEENKKMRIYSGNLLECMRSMPHDESGPLKVKGIGFEETSYYKLIKKENSEKKNSTKKLSRLYSKQTPLVKLNPTKQNYSILLNQFDKLNHSVHSSKVKTVEAKLDRSFEDFNRSLQNLKYTGKSSKKLNK